MSAEKFKIALTRDVLGADGATVFDPAALELLKSDPAVACEILPDYADEISAELAARYDGLVLLKPRLTAASLARPDRRLKVVARFGVGYDTVDVEACTRAGVVLTITPDGVRRPVATIILTFILALAQKLFAKDRITRAGRWQERTAFMGNGLTGKTVGSIGFGNIGRETFRLLQPLDMVHLACDPAPDHDEADRLAVRLVDLDTLLTTADFVSVSCPLSPATRHLIGARELGLMKSSAFLINTARGPIVDEAALTRALVDRRIAGAALDVFDQEPTPPDNPILTLDNVIVTPHSLCWTDEAFRNMAKDAFRSVLDIAHGRVPKHVVNRAVLAHPDLAALAQAR
jgi:phosphoglycerate dehydrogenase-like enzyme